MRRSSSETNNLQLICVNLNWQTFCCSSSPISLGSCPIRWGNRWAPPPLFLAVPLPQAGMPCKHVQTHHPMHRQLPRGTQVEGHRWLWSVSVLDISLSSSESTTRKYWLACTTRLWELSQIHILCTSICALTLRVLQYCNHAMWMFICHLTDHVNIMWLIMLYVMC